MGSLADNGIPFKTNIRTFMCLIPALKKCVVSQRTPCSFSDWCFLFFQNCHVCCLLFLVFDLCLEAPAIKAFLACCTGFHALKQLSVSLIFLFLMFYIDVDGSKCICFVSIVSVHFVCVCVWCAHSRFVTKPRGSRKSQICFPSVTTLIVLSANLCSRRSHALFVRLLLLFCVKI